MPLPEFNSKRGPYLKVTQLHVIVRHFVVEVGGHVLWDLSTAFEVTLFDQAEGFLDLTLVEVEVFNVFSHKGLETFICGVTCFSTFHQRCLKKFGVRIIIGNSC